MSARLAPARPRDAHAIGRILGDWIDQTDWMPRVHPKGSEPGFARLLMERGPVTTARCLGRVQGFLAREDDEVHALYIAPAARGRGIGGALIDHAKTGRDRLALWTFQANSGARRFYGAHGFREIEETDGAGNDEHLPDVRLIWERSA